MQHGGNAPLVVPRATGPVIGDLHPPGSKSLTQRWLLLAALAEGESTIENALRSDDVEALTQGLRTLGARIRWAGADTLVVQGVGGRFPGGGALDGREGGTPARFLMAAACMATKPSTLDGSSRLRKRPMRDGAELLAAIGAKVARTGTDELPLSITPADAFVRGGVVTIDRPASSQFLSAVALIAPWMQKGLQVQVRGGMPSDSYVELTVQCLVSRGVRATWDSVAGVLQVSPGALQAFRVRVEPDASSASYGFALAAVTPGSCVRVPGLLATSAQPDVAVATALAELGAHMHADTDGLSVRFGGALHGGSIDAERWPDGSLAVMAAAATSIEPIEIRGLATLAQKESDRIETMRAWLVDLGVRVERGEDWVRMQGPPRTGATAMVATQRDHRIAMSAAVLGALHGGVQVDDPGCVAKSWPDFWSSWAKLLGP